MSKEEIQEIEKQAEYLAKILFNVINCHNYSGKIVFLAISCMFFEVCQQFGLTRSEILNLVRRHSDFMNDVKKRKPIKLEDEND
jgi:hypothetical protein